MSIFDGLVEEDILGLDTSTAEMAIPDVSDMDTCAAALAYAAEGIYVLPVRRGDFKNPGSRVGKKWQTKSTIDRQDVIAQWAGTDDGIALHLGRSGLIGFDVDHPENLPQVLREALAATNGPYQSSDPKTPEKGHYVLRVPEGRNFGNGYGRLPKGWGEIRGNNGVIIAEPSPHERAAEGAEYHWQKTGPIPVLLASIADLLDDASPADDAATDATVAAFLAENTASIRPELLEYLCRVFTDKTSSGDSRHMTAVSVLTGAMKEAAAGYYSAATADEQLKKLFIKAVTDANHPGDTRDPRRAASEWSGIRAWAVAQALAADPEVTRARIKEKATPIDLGDFAIGSRPPRNVDPETGARVGGGEPPPDVDDFFDARPELDRLRTFAGSRRAAPWATTGVALVRCVCAVEPFVMLPPTIGGHASLNLFLGIVGPSGGGKGAAEAAGADAFNFGDLTTWGVGSGEGIPHLYLRRTKATDGVPAGIEQHTTRVLLRCPEVDTLGALKARSASTLLPKIRDAWIGDDLSFGYVDETKRLPLRAHSYRLGLIVGIQPERAGVLLEHADDGTPQRFAWVPARDPHVPLVAPDEPDPWPAWKCPRWPAATNGRSVLGVCTEAVVAMDEAAVARHRGEVGALDGHSLLARLKISAALGILNGRPEVNAEDWQLAGVFMAVSDHTRTVTAQTLAYKSTLTNRARGQAEGEREIVRTNTVTEAHAVGVARKLQAKLTGEWTTKTKLRGTLTSRDRHHFEDGIDRLIAAGTAEVEEREYRGQTGVSYRLTEGSK